MLRKNQLDKLLNNSLLPAFLAAGALLVWLLFFCDVENVFEFDSDDGNNVVKSLLVLEGHSFGDEIWSDQPPVFTFVVAGAFELFGTTMDVARAVVAAFSASVIFVVYDLLRRWGNHLHAIAGVILLCLSYRYIHLSLSVMIGLPAIAFAAFSLWCTERSQHTFALDRWMPRHANLAPTPTASRKQPSLNGWSGAAWLGASGVACALSLGTKLFTAPIVAVIALATAAVGFRAPSQQPKTILTQVRGGVVALTIWTAGLVVGGVVAFLPLIEAGTLSGLIEAHARSRQAATGGADGVRALRHFLEDDLLLFSLATLGFISAAQKRKTGPLWFGLWFLACFIGLYDHNPVWTHHRTLLTVPAAVLAGYGIGQTWSSSARLPAAEETHPANSLTDRTSMQPLPFFGLILLGTLLLFSHEDRIEEVTRPESWSNSRMDWRIFETFQKPAQHSTYVAAARPTHAFRANKPIPPNLAVTSSKRFVTGLLSANAVAQEIENYQPETVLISRRWPGSVRAAVRKEIRDSHVRIKRWRYQSTELWVAHSLAQRLDLKQKKTKKKKSRRRRPRN